jgi:molybdopterin converting factor small subunit
LKTISKKGIELKVKIKIFGEENCKEIVINQDLVKLYDLLTLLLNEYKKKFIQDGCLVLINDKIIVDNLMLKNGDEIVIMPILGGG